MDENKKDLGETIKDAAQKVKKDLKQSMDAAKVKLKEAKDDIEKKVAQIKKENKNIEESTDVKKKPDIQVPFLNFRTLLHLN